MKKRKSIRLGKRRRVVNDDDDFDPIKSQQQKKKRKLTKEKPKKRKRKKKNNKNNKKPTFTAFDRTGIMQKMREKHRNKTHKSRIVLRNDEIKKIQLTRDERNIISIKKKVLKDINILKKAIKKSDKDSDGNGDEKEKGYRISLTKRQCNDLMKNEKLLISRLEDIFSRFKITQKNLESRKIIDKTHDRVFYSLYDYFASENNHLSFFSLGLDETGVDLLSSKMTK